MAATAILKAIFSPDLPAGEPSLPPDPSNCWVVIHADIGLPGSGAADTFTFFVTTTSFLKRELECSTYQIGRGLIVLREFSWPHVSAAIEDVIGRCAGKTWVEIAARLSQYGESEYA